MHIDTKMLAFKPMTLIFFQISHYWENGLGSLQIQEDPSIPRISSTPKHSQNCFPHKKGSRICVLVLLPKKCLLKPSLELKEKNNFKPKEIPKQILHQTIRVIAASTLKYTEYHLQPVSKSYQILALNA